jgi:hypothetical protein
VAEGEGRDVNRYAYDHPDPVINNYLTSWVNLNTAIAHADFEEEERLNEWLDFLDRWLSKDQLAYVKSQAHMIPGTYENPYE